MPETEYYFDNENAFEYGMNQTLFSFVLHPDITTKRIELIHKPCGISSGDYESFDNYLKDSLVFKWIVMIEY